MKLAIPQTLTSEHEELHSTLVRATREPGAVGAAAKAVAALLHPHFAKEEEFALPPIALLPQLARGEVTPDMEEALVFTDRLERELDGMLKDHREITGALERLLAAARKHNMVDYAQFAAQLMRHAKSEELVIYPAAILAGRYIRLKLGMSER